jgi:probable rRNA maturation factor
MNLKHIVDVRIEHGGLPSEELTRQEVDAIAPQGLEDQEQQAIVQQIAGEALNITLLKVAALAALKHCDVRDACEITVVISGDPTLQDLNRRFRGVDCPTDVLAFPNDSRGPFAGGGPNFPHYLGDIVISLDRAQAQAESVGGTLNQELQLLVVHGTLHLLGYDHAVPKEKAQMWEIQRTILELLGVDVLLPDGVSGPGGDLETDELSAS